MADTRFFKLPYVGKYFIIAPKQIQNLVKSFCKDVNIKVALTPYKISYKFSYKDPLPFHLQSLSFTNLFVQAVRFAMWVKLSGTSSPESMNTI